MPFFERPEPPPEDEQEDDDYDVFADATSRYLGGVVPLELLVARSDTAAVVARGLVAYPDGFELTVVTYVRKPPETPRRRGRFGHRPMIIDPFQLYDEEDADLPAEFLRFGIEFPDGARVTNLAPPWPISPDATEPMHGLEPHSGGGSDTEYTQEFWAWPLPGDGALAFVCEWPAHGIPETRVEIDGRLVSEAGARAQPVWSELSGPNTHMTRGALMRRAAANRDRLDLAPAEEPTSDAD